MFLELCSGGDLHAWLNAQTMSSEPESRYIAYQLMLGLGVSVDGHGSHRAEIIPQYLHSNRIAHRGK